MEYNLLGIYERLIQFRKSFSLSQKEMAEKLGLPQTTYGHLENRAKGIDFEVLDKLRKLGLDINWLITGKGELPSNAAKPQESALESNIDQKIEEIFKDYSKVALEAIKQLGGNKEELEKVIEAKRYVDEVRKLNADKNKKP